MFCNGQIGPCKTIDSLHALMYAVYAHCVVGGKADGVSCPIQTQDNVALRCGLHLHRSGSSVQTFAILFATHMSCRELAVVILHGMVESATAISNAMHWPMHSRQQHASSCMVNHILEQWPDDKSRTVRLC